MRKFLTLLGIALASLGWPTARAEVVAAAAGGMTLRHEAVVDATPRNAERRFGRIADWWSSAHTYSGDARNLRLTLRPGGCWCETLQAGGFVEHMRLIYYAPGAEMRFAGGLGPLQAMAANGVLRVTFEADGARTRVRLDYVVTAGPGTDFASFAPGVDAVLAEQFGRYRALMDKPS